MWITVVYLTSYKWVTSAWYQHWNHTRYQKIKMSSVTTRVKRFFHYMVHISNSIKKNQIGHCHSRLWYMYSDDWMIGQQQKYMTEVYDICERNTYHFTS